MRDSISFYRTADGFMTFRSDTGFFKDLGSWMTSDIQSYAPECLEFLAILEDVRVGVRDAEVIEGNAYQAFVTPSDVRVQNMFVESGEDYTFDEAHSVIIEYWKWLTPAAEDRAAQIEAWSAEFGRQHPCLDHLG
ncbi:hypothetical protein [Catenuloplanes atrovinosus]|uniref:Uncharacterized protein n=1 Tax=Catenuloplanes atrovinosus TaxID=137266 RepID=A0AAE4CDF1_9ACTN|nr:hypothetical protein [Catenuloplanes atrovinosus]MDR7278984.1 hypothetical protein [Catenuloplanes atrovinosus]